MRSLVNNMKARYKSHPVLARFLIFLIVAAVGAYIFYLRFPNNALFPNFFAEDGQHFAHNILDKGFIEAILTPFNGYFIFGIYLLTGVGFLLNSLILGGEFINLPLSFAIVSYAFLGMCAALPILLLHQYMRMGYLLGLALLISLLPFPSFDYGTFGTLGNLKFAFGFIALMLVLYRATLAKNNIRIVAVDLLLAVCAFTTAGVYLILPFIILSDGLKVYQLSVLKNIRTLFTRHNISLWSGLVLAGLCASQVIFILANGLPDLPGYLDEPYEFAKTIEVFIARAYLFPFVSAAYHHLNDATVVVTFLLLLALTFTLGARKHWWLYGMIILSIFLTTLVFVANRTGTAHYYNDYSTSGFDNFFYAQNFMALLLAFLVLSDMTSRLRTRWRLLFPLAAIAILTAVSIRTNSVYAPNDFMQYKIGTIYQQAETACSTTKDDPITFSVYPFEFLTMTEPRQSICTNSLHAKRPSFDNLQLYALDNTAFDLHAQGSTFTQTFRATRNQLDGLGLYLGTYGNTVVDNYELRLMDGACERIIRNISLPTYVRDNSVREIQFEPVGESKDITFCFTVRPVGPVPEQLALWTSTEDTYKTGEFTLNGSSEPRDVIFFPLYK